MIEYLSSEYEKMIKERPFTVKSHTPGYFNFKDWWSSIYKKKLQKPISNVGMKEAFIGSSYRIFEYEYIDGLASRLWVRQKFYRLLLYNSNFKTDPTLLTTQLWLATHNTHIIKIVKSSKILPIFFADNADMMKLLQYISGDVILFYKQIRNRKVASAIEDD